MIRLEAVGWTFPHADAPALRGIDLTVAAGELVVICGASGSGKSTLLRTMNGLIPHFSEGGVLTGSVTVGGLATAEVELDQLGLVTGTVLQHPRRQFFTDTVAQEIAFAMENFGLAPADIRARVGQLVAELPSTAGSAALRWLSGGLQQQVAIAAATAHRPRVVLFDEPSSNLASDAVGRLSAALASLKAQGLAVVVAEHRLRYLSGLADRVIVLRDGTVEAEWPAAEFQALPDAVLAEHGLRGEVRPAVLPPAEASGPSVAPEAGAGRSARPSGGQSGQPGAGHLPKAGAGLELEGVRCRLGGRLVLDLDRAVFPAGQVTAVRGPNGVGKSTLARIVTGLQKAEGTVRLGGRPLTRRARQRSSAIVMQDPQRQLFADSVRAEIELAASASSSKARPGARPPATAAVLDALDLADLAERHPLSLSGGQTQRLVVAAARLSGRGIVVFDEPSSGVDRRHLRSISNQIRAAAASPAAVLLISHDEDLLAQAADRHLTLQTP
ncbi:MAG: ABC transporter ATP-binding protein [Bifidobacteriaceae bacterium]|nr:ABC transporter ATP-binding protein [Bifidobacteriaceae bacterium]